MENEVKNEASTELASREVVENYLKDEKVSTNLLTWANVFNDRFNGNNFSVDQVIKKTPVKSKETANMILGLLVLKGLAVRTVNNTKYKIVVDSKVKLHVLEMKLADLKTQCTNLEQEISSLKEQSSISE